MSGPSGDGDEEQDNRLEINFDVVEELAEAVRKLAEAIRELRQRDA